MLGKSVKNKSFKAGNFLIPLLIFVWIFSSWPRIWNSPPFPPKIDHTFAFNYFRESIGTNLNLPITFTVSLNSLEEINNDRYCQFTVEYNGYTGVSAPFPSSLNMSAVMDIGKGTPYDNGLPSGKAYLVTLRCAPDDITNEYNLLIHNNYPDLMLEDVNWGSCDDETIMCVPIFEVL